MSPSLEQELPLLLEFHKSHPNIRITTRSDPDYRPLLKPFNLNNTARPIAIISPKDEGELAAAVRFCTTQTPPIPLTVRSGGHDIHGRYISDDAVLLDVRGISNIDIAPARDHVTIGTGVRGNDLFPVLEAQGLSTAIGWCGGVSVTGWAAGGGYGIANGVWGLGVDNILGARVVTPGLNGEIVDTDQDPELLWAIRGAGLGNFGVISELRLKVHQRPRHIAGLLVFPLAEARTVLLDKMQRMESEGRIPGNFNAEFLVGNTPGLGSTLTFLWSWLCDPDSDESLQEGWKLLGDFQKFGTVLLNTVGETSILPIMQFLDTMYTGNEYNHLNSAAVSGLTPELVDILIQTPPPPNDFRSVTLFHHAHHRAAQPDTDSVFNIRQNHYLYGLSGTTSHVSTPEETEETINWANNIFERLKATKSALKQGYCSFSRPEHADAVEYFGIDKVERLRALKQKYNPDAAFPKAYPVL